MNEKWFNEMVGELTGSTANFDLVKVVTKEVMSRNSLNIPEFLNLPLKETVITLLVVFAEAHENYNGKMAKWSSQILMMKLLSCNLHEDAKKFLKTVEDQSYLDVFESVLRALETYDRTYSSTVGSKMFTEMYTENDIPKVVRKLSDKARVFHIKSFFKNDLIGFISLVVFVVAFALVIERYMPLFLPWFSK